MSTTRTVHPPTIESDAVDPETSKRGRNGPGFVFTVVIVVIAVIAGGLIAARAVRSDRASQAGPAAVIEQYVEAFNEGDIDAMMNQFADDAQLIGHPFAAEAFGATAIRDVQIGDLANAAPTDAIRVSDLEVVGDVVTWNQVYENRRGEFTCATGNRAVVVDDEIVRWEFAEHRHRCP